MSVWWLARRLTIALIGLLVCLPLPARATGVGALFESDELSCFKVPSVVSDYRGTVIAVVEQRFSYRSIDFAAYMAMQRAGQLRHDTALRCPDAGFTNLVARRSTDHGQTWSEVSLIVDHRSFLAPDYRVALAGNPTLVFVPQSKQLLLLFTVARTRGNDNSAPCIRAKWAPQPACQDVPADQETWITRSDDMGVTWSAPQPLNLLDPPIQDLQRPGPGHGIVLPSGRIVVGAYPNLLLSDDGGKCWRYGAATAAKSETSVVLLDDGSVWSSVRLQGKPLQEVVDQNGRSTWRLSAYSNSDGESYDRIVPDDRLPVPRVHIGLLRFAPIAARPATIVASFPSPRSISDPPDVNADRYRLMVAVADGTAAQFRGRFVHAGPAGYSDLADIGHCRIGILYEGAPTIEPVLGTRSHARYVLWKTINLAVFNRCVERRTCFKLVRPLPRRFYD